MAVFVPIRAGSAIQDRSHHLQGSIDGRCAHTGGPTLSDEGRERGIVDVVRLERSQVPHQQPNVDPNGFQASFVARLCQITCRAVAEQRVGVSTPSDFNVDVLDLCLQALFGLFLRDRTDAHADANAAVALVDEAASVDTDRDAGRAGRSHGSSFRCKGRASWRLRDAKRCECAQAPSRFKQSVGGGPSFSVVARIAYGVISSGRWLELGCRIAHSCPMSGSPIARNLSRGNMRRSIRTSGEVRRSHLEAPDSGLLTRWS
jgi:hypothetical protein